MTDKEIVLKLMMNAFEDDNTFSKTPLNYAILGIQLKTKLENGEEMYSTEYNETFNTDIPFMEYELKIVDYKTFMKDFYSKEFELIDIMNLYPVIKFKE